MPPDSFRKCTDLTPITSVSQIGVVLDISVDEVEKALKSFPKLSNGGPGGIKPGILQDLLLSSVRNRLLDALNGLVKCLAQGIVPLDIQSLLVGAELTALSKPGGGVHPICGGVHVGTFTVG